MPSLPCPLDRYGRRLLSQYDEDGIIDELVRRLDPPHEFVEFGCHPTECNCLALTSWRGLFMDGHDYGDPRIKREFVTPDNINDLLDKYGVSQEFGVLSIDVDGQELWIWEAITRKPWIVVTEYNPQLGPDISVSIPRDDEFRWNGSIFQGASLKALTKIGNAKGYRLVHANGQNAFFVRCGLFDNANQFKYEDRWRPSKANHPPDKLNRKFVEI